MLGGQNLRRCKQRRLATGVDDGQHRPQCHQGLPGPDLALKKALHRSGQGQVGEDRLADLVLARREFEREALIEGGQQPIGAPRSRLGRVPGRIGTSIGHRELSCHRLVEDQALRSSMRIGQTDRLVD
ncbi:hypothetical protein SDC9_212446 [bioreactor metagenome]|uniref:Uncharacterized protein n=1 Tax=bioreactor metagenome TaxID=1076179 RepID=A0A645JNJ5_9ZZZZ